jgi:long-chain acyl-CoA synthetase
VIDRIKNIFKLSHGGFITPEKLENIYARSKYFTNVFISGLSHKEYIVAFVYPNPDSFAKDET